MSEQTKAVIKTAVFLLLAPGTVAGWIPWLITRWEMPGLDAIARAAIPLGVALIVVGTGFLLHAFARFALQGLGTPSPTAPTKHLVVSGVYRWVRNPMYLSVQSVIIGQVLLFGSLKLALYSAATIVAMWATVRFYEEPKLLKEYGSEYEEYRSRVPRWWPRRPVD